MKRFINWLTDWFNGFNWKGNVSAIVGIVCGIIIGLFAFITCDKIPATPSDYQYLEQDAEYFDDNINSLLEKKVNAEEITIKFENDDCEVSIKYDSNLNKMETTKEDKAIPWWAAVAIAVFLGVWMYFLVLLIMMALLTILEKLWKAFHKKR